MRFFSYKKYFPSISLLKKKGGKINSTFYYTFIKLWNTMSSIVTIYMNSNIKFISDKILKIMDKVSQVMSYHYCDCSGSKSNIRRRWNFPQCVKPKGFGFPFKNIAMPKVLLYCHPGLGYNSTGKYLTRPVTTFGIRYSN